MGPLDIFLIALSLSLDAVAVSLAIGMLHGFSFKNALLAGAFFGGFQALMPFLGWLGGAQFGSFFMEHGNVIGFVLLLLVGVKMLRDSLKEEKEEKEGTVDKNMLALKVLTMLAVATSIDALVVGITFGFVEVSVPLAIASIGVFTFFASIAGVVIGAKTKHLSSINIEIIGALVLIALSFKILLF